MRDHDPDTALTKLPLGGQLPNPWGARGISAESGWCWVGIESPLGAVLWHVIRDCGVMCGARHATFRTCMRHWHPNRGSSTQSKRRKIEQQLQPNWETGSESLFPHGDLLLNAVQFRFSSSCVFLRSLCTLLQPRCTVSYSRGIWLNSRCMRCGCALCASSHPSYLGGGGLQSPKPEKIAVKLRKIAAKLR